MKQHFNLPQASAYGRTSFRICNGVSGNQQIARQAGIICETRFPSPCQLVQLNVRCKKLMKHLDCARVTPPSAASRYRGNSTSHLRLRVGSISRICNHSLAFNTQPDCGSVLQPFYTVVYRMFESEDESWHSLHESLEGAKAEVEDQIVSEVIMSNPDIEDSTAHESKPNNEETNQERMLIIAGEHQRSFE